jgi:hypothetical protein
MPKAKSSCEWPREKIERVRKILNDNRKRWPEVADLTCVGERYIRAFARRQITNPPADRFMLIAQAIVDLSLRTAEQQPKKKEKRQAARQPA